MLEGLSVAVVQPRGSRELKAVYPVLFCPVRGPMLCVVFFLLSGGLQCIQCCLLGPLRLFVVCRGLGGTIFVWEGVFAKGFTSMMLIMSHLSCCSLPWPVLSLTGGGVARGGKGWKGGMLPM